MFYIHNYLLNKAILLVNDEFIKNNNANFTYEQLLREKDNLDNLLMHESAFYIETICRTIDKPFINPGNFF